MRFKTLLLLAFAASVHPTPARSQASPPITIAADLTDAPRKILRADLSLPVQPGPLTLLYPQWIPGEHAPDGPIDNLAGIVFRAQGRILPWKRDSADMYAFHLQVPDGVTLLEAHLEFLATAAASGFSAGASTSANLALLSWNELVLYPAGKPASEITVQPSVKLPAGWQFGTALQNAAVRSPKSDAVAAFLPVKLDTLIDSPLLAGRYFKEIALAEDVTPKHYLDLAADGPEALNISADRIKAYGNLVHQARALYKSTHYGAYHFLLTLSDQVAHFGLEHHESSDDRIEEKTFLDDDLALIAADLLPHEFTHSWNGKYRRPAGLLSPDYQQPMKGDLLWVYEGLTQYLGDVLAARSGIVTPDQFRARLAASAAELDQRPGRVWRSLQDTAVSAQILYGAGEHWENWRRSVDYYAEGELLWLDIDVLIRNLSRGKKSLNNFCAAFLGLGGNTGPAVSVYTFEDVVAALNAVQPYDWAAFLKRRLDANDPAAPLDGITAGGYKLEFAPEPNEYSRAAESKLRTLNAWYSLGLRMSDSGEVQDVLIDSPAYRAGVGPGMTVIAVNSRKASEEQLRRAIQSAQKSHQKIEMILENTEYFRTVFIDCTLGERYPKLIRVESKPAVLDEILKPLEE